MDTVHECDRRTDGRMDRITITKTVQRIATHGKNRTLVTVLVGPMHYARCIGISVDNTF